MTASATATAARVAPAPEPPASRPRRVGATVLDLAVLALFAAAVVALYVSRSRTFFLMDDAQNEFLPFFTDMGRQWLHGHVPVVTSHALFGDNYFIAIERPIFAPQTILFAVLAASFPHYVVIATAFAATNVFLAAVGGWLIGRALRLGRLYGLLLAATVSTVPVFLFMYNASWWNAAIGTVWLTFAVAALLYAVRRPSVRASVLLGVAGLLVLVSGWPHALIGLLVIGACILLATTVVPGGWRALHRDGAWRAVLLSWLPVLVPLVLAVLVASPLYAEFVSHGDLLYRFNKISNDGNFCVPGLDQTLGVMNPVAKSYWNCWGGYTNWPFPVGYVSILTTVALVFWWPRRGDRVAGALISAAVVLVVLSQLPSTFSSTRYPFRFLPLLALVLAALIFHLLQHGVRRFTRRRVALAVVITVAAAFVGVSRDALPDGGDILLALLVVALTLVGIAVVAPRWQRFRPAVFSLLTLAGIVLVALQGHGLATRFLYYDPLLRDVHLSAEQQAQVDHGFVAVAQMPNSVASAGSARSLLLGWRSFNGYDPVGQKAFMLHFGDHAPQGFYDAGLLKVLGEPAQVGGADVCDFQLYGVRSVIAQADLDDTTRATLERCGFTRKSTVGGSSFWTSSARPVGATLSYAEDGIGYGGDHLAGERHESASITANPDGGTVVFARLWWPGYTATLDGKPVPTSSYEGILTAVHLPAGATGKLELSYTPTSWRWSLPLAGLGVLLSIGAVAVVVVRRSRSRRDGSVTGSFSTDDRTVEMPRI